MQVSVIVVSYYTGDILLKSIDSILKQKNLLELIIVNNGNDVETNQKLSLLKSHYIIVALHTFIFHIFSI
jgi:glycosyltransferase involved in cell wall biosynthesis